KVCYKLIRRGKIGKRRRVVGNISSYYFGCLSIEKVNLNRLRKLACITCVNRDTFSRDLSRSESDCLIHYLRGLVGNSYPAQNCALIVKRQSKLRIILCYSDVKAVYNWLLLFVCDACNCRPVCAAVDRVAHII